MKRPKEEIKKNICKTCGHRLIKWINPKNKKDIRWLHYNRYYFGAMAINDKWCSLCEVLHLGMSKKFEFICKKPDRGEIYGKKDSI